MRNQQHQAIRPHRSRAETRTGVFCGGLLALLTVPVHLVVSEDASELLSALLIAAIAAVYVGFAIADGRRRTIALQAAVCLAFVVAAAALYRAAPMALPVLYVLHGLWDLLHHRTTLPMPRWYVPLCLVYDLATACALWAIWLS